MTNKKNVSILFLICFLQGLVFYYPIATLYRTSHGLTLVEISIIESLSFIVTLLLEIPWGYLGDRWGLKRVLVVANGLYFVSKLIFYIADSFSIFLLERILLGVALAGISGCDSSLLYLSSGDNHVKVFSWYSLCGTVGMLLASLVYSMLLVDNYSMAALLCAVMYFLAFLLTLLLEDIKEEKTSNESPKIIMEHFLKLKENPILLFVVATVLFSETIREITLFIGQVRLLEVGLLASLFGVIAFLLTLAEFSSLISEKYSKLLGYSKSILFSIVLTIATSIIIGYFDSPYIVAIGLLFLTMNSAVLSPVFETIQQESVDSEYRASTISIYNVFASSIAVLLNVFYGYIGDVNSKLVYYVASSILLMAFIMMKIYFKKASKK